MLSLSTTVMCERPMVRKRWKQRSSEKEGAMR